MTTPLGPDTKVTCLVYTRRPWHCGPCDRRASRRGTPPHDRPQPHCRPHRLGHAALSPRHSPGSTRSPFWPHPRSAVALVSAKSSPQVTLRAKVCGRQDSPGRDHTAGAGSACRPRRTRNLETPCHCPWGSTEVTLQCCSGTSLGTSPVTCVEPAVSQAVLGWLTALL